MASLGMELCIGYLGNSRKGMRIEFLEEINSVLKTLGGIFPSDRGSKEGKDSPSREKIMLHVTGARNSFRRAIHLF